MKFIKSFLTLVILATSVLHARFEIESVPEVRVISEAFVQDNPRLHGNEMAEGLRKHLVSRGFTFAQVTFANKKGLDVLVVKEGKIGSSSVTGNKFLSAAGIAEYLNWQEGQPFNYGIFQRNAASLNRRSFIEVDTKLAPTRTSDGEILVNADFTAKDSIPIAGSLNTRGNFKVDGADDQDSDAYRATLGLEYWEPFMDNDRLSASVTTDPAETSELLSLSLQYKFGPKELSQFVYGGYFESEANQDDVKSANDRIKALNPDNSNLVGSLIPLLSPSGKGYHGGYQGSYSLENLFLEDFALTYGFSYLDVYDKQREGETEKHARLYMPRIGLRGSFQNPGFSGLGNTFWSLSGTYDVSEKKLNDKLFDKKDPARRNFYYADLYLTTYQPFNLAIIEGGALFRLAGRYTSDVLPNVVKFRTGGGFSGTGVRGFTENEDKGDRGVVFNFEYRIKQLDGSLPGVPFKYQPFFFYDASHVYSESYTLDEDLKPATSSNLQSIGLGVLGNFGNEIDLSLNAGVPIVNGKQSKRWRPRIHCDLTWKF
jgi:hemolysin activation/secretion protein